MVVKCKDHETVVFSWITWPSRKMRDEGMKKVMADPRLQPDTNPMPFDGTRRSKKYRDRAEECRPELRLLDAAAQAGIVSVARIRLDSGNLRDLSKG
jgi:hypothetical protein